VACLEEIAFKMNYIDAEQVKRLAEPFIKNDYGKYLLNMLKYEGAM
jgi:glucose-1-phosphate thymidylyltransferase